MYFGINNADDESVKDNIEIKINNVSDDKYYVNVCIKNIEDYYCSSFIQTMPYCLCYYGDMGDFLFSGNITTKQPLLFFAKHSYFDNKVNYDYLFQKLENKLEAKVFDSEVLKASCITYITNFCTDDDFVYDQTKSIDDQCTLLYEYFIKYDKEDAFEDLMNCIDEGETRLGQVYDILSEEFDYNCDSMTIKHESYTSQFIECCDRLAYFANTILEKIKFKEV